MDKYYVSKERLEELKEELENLKIKKRLEVAERLKTAKEFGDLSENSEYTEARDEQAQVERRIFELEQMIKNASLITKEGLGKDWVKIGSTIIVSKNGKEQRFTIVGSSEANPSNGFISNESPLGKAFLDKRVSETVKVKIPAGEATYRIDKIE